MKSGKIVWSGPLLIFDNIYKFFEMYQIDEINRQEEYMSLLLQDNSFINLSAINDLSARNLKDNIFDRVYFEANMYGTLDL